MVIWRNGFLKTVELINENENGNIFEYVSEQRQIKTIYSDACVDMHSDDE